MWIHLAPGLPTVTLSDLPDQGHSSEAAVMAMDGPAFGAMLIHT